MIKKYMVTIVKAKKSFINGISYCIQFALSILNHIESISIFDPLTCGKHNGCKSLFLFGMFNTLKRQNAFSISYFEPHAFNK
jgi:hypothetical protein